MQDYKGEFVCPYCGMLNKHSFRNHWDRTLSCCDEEEGGCGGLLVLEVKAKTTVTITPKKIEGEGPQEVNNAH